MYLRFENDTPIYSFNETEQERLTKIIEELDKIRYLPWKYKNRAFTLLEDNQTLKTLKIFLRSKFENNICIEEYKEKEEYNYQKILNNYFYILYEYSKKNTDEIPDCIREEIKNYHFIVSNRFQIVTILKKPGIIDQFNISIDLNTLYNASTNTTIQNCYNKCRFHYL